MQVQVLLVLWVEPADHTLRLKRQDLALRFLDHHGVLM